MPDTKFSWRGLREHLRQYWWLYLLGIAVSLVGTSLLWTMTEPRFSNQQCVSIALADSYTNPEPLQAFAPDILARLQAEDDSIKQVTFESLMYNDELYTSSMLLLTRLSVGEHDAFLASQTAMDALVSSGVLVPLDEYVMAGWLGEYGLEPYVVTTEEEADEEGAPGESVTWTAGLRLDSLDVLVQMGAFNNEGAFLCVAGNSGDIDTTMKALEYLLSDLKEAAHAGTEAS